MSYYIVMTSSAQVRGKAKFGRYRNIAVVEVKDGHPTPAMISARARGVVRIVRHYGSCSVGTTERCQYERYYKQATELCETLNHEESARLAWYQYCDTHELPPDIPRDPHIVYADDGWAGWCNWIGETLETPPDRERKLHLSSE